MMRAFGFIFSFYLLFLSVQPCQDFAASGSSSPRIQSEQTQFFNDGENQEPESHECSPFCICSCRQMPVAEKISAIAPSEQLAVFNKSTAQISYRNDYFYQHLNFIWQPPRI